jgi:aryl-alcohol dehydrogenase-like predicted oxidoreductase
MRDTIDFSSKRYTVCARWCLKRLQQDYLDLYQLHWPKRKTNTFGQRLLLLNDEWEDNIRSTNHFDGFIKEGKIKHIGLTMKMHGVMRFFRGRTNTIILPRVKRFHIQS